MVLNLILCSSMFSSVWSLLSTFVKNKGILVLFIIFYVLLLQQHKNIKNIQKKQDQIGDFVKKVNRYIWVSIFICFILSLKLPLSLFFSLSQTHIVGFSLSSLLSLWRYGDRSGTTSKTQLT